MSSNDTTIARQHAQSMHQYFSEGADLPLRESGLDFPMPVHLPMQSSAQGDLRTGSLAAFIQTRATYNKRPANFREFTAGGGSVTYASREFKASCTSTLASYGVLRSLRSLNFKSGFGAAIRFKGRFETGVAGTWQGIGGFNLGDEYSFGYSGTSFGIWHRYGGFGEVQRLTITGAAGGSENATLTLDGTAHTIALTTGTAAHNAFEIATWLNANQSAVNARQNGDTVTMLWQSDGNKTGTMSFTSDTATGTLAEITAGVTKTSDFIAQADWNGTTPENFDPTKYNSYQIDYEGNAHFHIEDPITSQFHTAHTIQYLNSTTEVRVGDPALRIGLYATNVGGASAVSCYAASLSGFVDGEPRPIRNPRGAENTKSVSSGTETAIITLRNVEVLNGVANQVEIEPLAVSLSNEGSKTVTFRIRGNATLGGDPNFSYENEDNLVSETDTSATTASGGLLIGVFDVAGGESKEIDLSPYRIRIPPTIAYTVSAEFSTGSATDIGVGLTWYEDE